MAWRIIWKTKSGRPPKFTEGEFDNERVDPDHTAFLYPKAFTNDEFKATHDHGKNQVSWTLPFKSISHVTDLYGAKRICNDEGFKSSLAIILHYDYGIKDSTIIDTDPYHFLWFSPDLDPSSGNEVKGMMRDRIIDYLRHCTKGMSRSRFNEELAERTSWMDEILSSYGSSPAFSSSSMFGNFKFSLNFKALVDHYKETMDVNQIDFRILGTFAYAQEQLYAVLICPSLMEEFSKYPLLDSSNSKGIVELGYPDCIWRVQSTGTTKRFLIPNFSKWSKKPCFGILDSDTGERISRPWEVLPFAFYLPKGKILKIPELVENHLTPCSHQEGVHRLSRDTLSVDEAALEIQKLKEPLAKVECL